MLCCASKGSEGCEQEEAAIYGGSGLEHHSGSSQFEIGRYGNFRCGLWMNSQRVDAVGMAGLEDGREVEECCRYNLFVTAERTG